MHRSFRLGSVTKYRECGDRNNRFGFSVAFPRVLPREDAAGRSERTRDEDEAGSAGTRQIRWQSVASVDEVLFFY